MSTLENTNILNIKWENKDIEALYYGEIKIYPIDIPEPTKDQYVHYTADKKINLKTAPIGFYGTGFGDAQIVSHTFENGKGTILLDKEPEYLGFKSDAPVYKGMPYLSPFEGYQHLYTIALPDTIKDLGKIAFADCFGLRDITIPSQLETIGNQAFRNCVWLEEIHLPETFKSFLPTSSQNDGVFMGCENLKRIICDAPISPIIDADTFYDISNNGTLIVPSGSNYSTWMRTDQYYLGYYGWTIQN